MNNSNKNFLEHKVMTIEVITPVCCSDGVTLNKKEYLYDNKKRKIYLLHKLEFGKYLNGRRWLNNFERYMQGKEHDEMSLYEWLQCMAGHKGVTIEQLGKAVLATVDVQVEIKRNGEGKPVNDMNPTIHLVDGNVYIPGSTIKGMLRTAILFHLIRQKIGKTEERYIGDKYKATSKICMKTEEMSTRARKLLPSIVIQLIKLKRNCCLS